MSSDEREGSLLAQASVWVPPWARRPTGATAAPAVAPAAAPVQPVPPVPPASVEAPERPLDT
ncbi:MAG: SMC-Scp complex subunit ScpB, partial [Dactylosporangium sp.]|nr:SMC-Scp complex subunit ScpB [Dactylosporangium sp.]NNJ61016.1 SMC-Scp complex subunit ScpB [Dactylosporangium sp.]